MTPDNQSSVLTSWAGQGWAGLGWAGPGWAGGEGAVFNVTLAGVGGGEELLPQVWQCETIIILVSGSGLV